MDAKIKPIFIFSLPRSGSTLLQKLLMTHGKIASVSEPWILLPFVGAYREKGTLADYSHLASYRAVEDFVQNLGGEESYHEILRDFILNLYGKAAQTNNKREAVYFLDKTPRYFLIIPQIARLFPHAKFVFLFRNPLSVFASVIQTWHNNRLKFHFNYIDLFEGPRYLLEGYKLLKNRSIKINYHSLVNKPDKELQKVAEFLQIPVSGFNSTEFKHQELPGTMGDPEGINKYDRVSAHSIDRWRGFCNSIFRKRVMLSYVKNLDEEYLSLMETNHKDLLEQIKSIKTFKPGIRDFIDYSMTCVYRRARLLFQLLGGRNFFKERKKRKVVYY